MKYLFSLSLKYLKRQKARTFLVFASITLAVFILCTVCAYFGSLIISGRNYYSNTEGSWEIHLTDMLEAADDPYDTAIKTMSDQVIDNFYMYSENQITAPVNNQNNRISFIEVDFGNGTVVSEPFMKQLKILGDSSIANNSEKNFPAAHSEIQQSDDIILPENIKSSGLNIGDSITVTFTPVTASIDTSSEQVISIYGKTDKYPTAPLIMNSLLGLMNMEDIQLTDTARGQSFQYTFNIAGFSDDISQKNTFCFMTYASCPNIIETLYSDNSEFFGDISESETKIDSYARIKNNLDFEDSLLKLLDNLGYDKSEYYFVFDNKNYNTSLLAFEFKKAYSAVGYLPVFFIVIILIFLAWIIARFIIDNAFEISTQERSSQFALLRIIGTSKKHIMMFTFSEASVYCLTAVPAGAALAFFSCSALMTSLSNSGMSFFEFGLNPIITVIGLFLCILAIFVSAYTSAQWAAGKLSPAEALNFGKPVRNKKNSRKLQIGSRRFIYKYTFKNILRTKRRFIISTIAMSLGIALFTVSLLGGMTFLQKSNEIKESIENGTDFTLSFTDKKNIEAAGNIFKNKELFNNYMLNIDTYAAVTEEGRQVYSEITGHDKFNAMSVIEIKSSDRKEYENSYQELIGMTYDEFVSSGTAVIAVHSNDNNSTFIKNSSNSAIMLRDNYSIPVYGILQISNLNADDHLILPSENINLAGDTNPFTESMHITVNVNGYENYNEALKETKTFISSLEGSYFKDSFYKNTGLKVFITAIAKIFAVFTVSVWLAGIISMINSINTSVLNRQTELSMMRSVGMNQRQLESTVVTESVLFASLSTLIGIAAGIPLFIIFAKMTNINITVNILHIVSALVITISSNLLISVLSAIPGIKTLKKHIII